MVDKKQILADAQNFNKSVKSLISSSCELLIQNLERAGKICTPEQKSAIMEVAEGLKKANAHGEVKDLNEGIDKFKRTFNCK